MRRPRVDERVVDVGDRLSKAEATGLARKLGGDIDKTHTVARPGGDGTSDSLAWRYSGIYLGDRNSRRLWR